MSGVSKKTQNYWNSRVEEIPLGVGTASINDQNLRTTGVYAMATLHCLTRNFPIQNLINSTVMDFGSGSGRLANLFAPYVKKVICAEVSDKFLDRSRENLAEFSNVEYLLVESPPKFDFRNEEIDLVYSYASLGSMPDKKVFFKTINQIDRISKNFCLEIPRVPQNPKTNFILSNLDYFDTRLLESFVPDDKTIQSYFESESYFIEYLAPEPSARGRNRFFYKVQHSNLHQILYFGPETYEKVQHFDLKKYSGMLQPILPKRVVRRIKIEFRRAMFKISTITNR